MVHSTFQWLVPGPFGGFLKTPRRHLHSRYIKKDMPKFLIHKYTWILPNILFLLIFFSLLLADPKSKRRSLKLLRGHERDLKLDIGKCKSCRLDTLPARVATMVNIPTLVSTIPLWSWTKPSSWFFHFVFKTPVFNDKNMDKHTVVELL